MTTIADKLLLLDSTKADIHAAIEEKGVDVPAELPFSGYGDKIRAIETGGSTGSNGGYMPPPDWEDIGAVGDNEINLLVCDLCLATVAFYVATYDSGQYNVDWGDGTSDTYANCATAQHTYTVGSGKTCSFGYTTFKVRIWAGTSILYFGMKPHSLAMASQATPILGAVIGASELTSLAYAFYGGSGQLWATCPMLTFVTLPQTLDNLTSLSMFVQGCFNLRGLVFPLSLPLLTSANQMCYSCYALSELVLPESMPLLTNLNNAFGYCFSLPSIILPASLPELTTLSSLCYNCSALNKLTLPTSAPKATSAAAAVQNCYTLKMIENIEGFGSTTAEVDMGGLTMYSEQLESLTINAKLKAIGAGAGNTTVRNRLTSMRLLNPNSTFSGYSPQVSCRYTMLDAAALNTLFGDLPVLTGKTIDITGAVGAAACDRSIATAKGWTVTG